MRARGRRTRWIGNKTQREQRRRRSFICNQLIASSPGWIRFGLSWDGFFEESSLLGAGAVLVERLRS